MVEPQIVGETAVQELDSGAGENVGAAAPAIALEQRRDLACVAGVVVPALILYFVCACRTVFVGDSGELAAVAATYGIPHPSGYPLYALSSGLWVQLFGFGSKAFAANTFSAVCSAAALGLLTAFLLELLKGHAGRRAAAVGTALLVAVSTAWWQESTVARVYHLNSLLSIATLWCACNPRRRPRY